MSGSNRGKFAFLLTALNAASAVAGTSTYTYDARGDLTSAAYSGGPAITYAYDPLGNRTSETVTNAPIAQNSNATVPYNATNASLPLTVSNATALQITANPGHGGASVSGIAILYSPTTGFSGADSLSYVATNSVGSSGPAIVSIAVNPAPPVTGNVNAAVAFSSGFTNIPLSLSGGAASSVAIAAAAAHGSTQASGLAISYQPVGSYFGSDSFTYTASNVSGTSSPGTAYITVNPAPPTAGAISQTVLFNSGYTNITLSLGGGTATGVAVASGPSHGATQISGTAISYKPTTGYSGADSFTYTASNAGGTSSPATASITVAASAFTASIAAGSSSQGASTSHTFGSNTVTVGGGSGSFTYAWGDTNDAAGAWSAGGTSATFTPSVSGVTIAKGCYSAATYSAVVTDTVSGQHVTTNGAAYAWKNTSTGCSN